MSKLELVSDIERVVAEAYPPTVGMASSMPVPGWEDTSRGAKRVAFVMHFGQPVLAHKQIMYPPRFLTVVDLDAGEVVRHEYCEPSMTFGIDEAPLHRHTSFGLAHVTVAEFWAGRKRIAEISPRVFELYFASPTPLGEADAALVAEYQRVFGQTTYAPLVKYLVAVAPRFFEWLAAHRSA